MTGFRYRPDIDGLRALAVLLVLLAHGKLGFQAGFIGVDVFFVISGFVITGRILQEQQNRSFRIRNFWLRRIRRILPVSVLVVLATLVAGYVILLPDDYQELAKSVMAQQFLVANQFFLTDIGYFSRKADLKPLLHTWSLAVEEQFYLVYPVVLVMLQSFSRLNKAWVLLFLALVCFAFNQWSLRESPEVVFYTMPARAWEMLLGGLICLIYLPEKVGPVPRNLLSVAGMIGILAAGTFPKLSAAFPGLNVLLACISTALVISSNSQNSTWCGKFLALKPVVFLGLISYSLYLWHWPILSFSRYLMSGRKLDTHLVLIGLVISVILAWLSFRYLESPIRNRRFLLESRKLLACLLAVITFLFCGSQWIVWNKGLRTRFNSQVLAYADTANRRTVKNSLSTAKVKAGEIPRFGKPRGCKRCLILGDSHAMALVSGLNSACLTYEVEGLQINCSGTSPLLNFSRPDSTDPQTIAMEFTRAAIDYAISNHIDYVVIAALWGVDVQSPAFETSLKSTVQELVDAGIRVALVRDVAIYKGSVPLMLAQALRWGQDIQKIGISPRVYAVVNGRCNSMFEQLASDRVTILDPAPWMVDESGLWRSEMEGVSLYRDHSHLSTMGSLRLAPMFEQWFQALNDMESEASGSRQ